MRVWLWVVAAGVALGLARPAVGQEPPLVSVPWHTTGCMKGKSPGRCVQESNYTVIGEGGLPAWVRFIQDDRPAVKEAGHYVLFGLADNDGATVVPPRFQRVVPISERAALVWDGGPTVGIWADGKESGAYTRVHTLNPGGEIPMQSAVEVPGGTAFVQWDGSLAAPIPHVTSIHHAETFVLVQSETPEGARLSTFVDRTGQPTWIGPRVEILPCDSSLWPARGPRAAVVLNDSPLPFGEGLLHPIDRYTQRPMELSEGVVGFVAYPDHNGCTSAWIAVYKEDGALRYRVSVVPPEFVLRDWQVLEPLEDVARTFEVFGSSYMHHGAIAGRRPGGPWIAADGTRPDLRVGAHATGETPREAVWAMMVAADERLRAEREVWLASERAREERLAGDRAEAAKTVEELLASGTDLDRARDLAIHTVGDPDLTLRVIARAPVQSSRDAERVCATPGAACDVAREQARTAEADLRDYWSRQDAALRSSPLVGVPVRQYDAHGNFLGTTTMSVWQADIVSW